eukprot:TRINITY_DN1502_c0_g2_i11.p3 TRINITY_DN1502_c0_g2~~TRINITY_DN1502_c0_g2_i11.p3  ORF type:complete len:218 (+),score=48.29 TRINITY_DN1502_c0_g2_i11:153-806(+)
MLVHINVPNGESVAVEIEQDTTLADVKEGAALALGAAASRIGLLFAGDRLADNGALQGLDDGDALDLVLEGEPQVYRFAVPSIRDDRSPPGNDGNIREVSNAKHVVESQGEVIEVRASASVFKDQGWGNKKGHVYLVQKRAGIKINQACLLGRARDVPTSNVSKRTHPKWNLAVGDTLCIGYHVGDNGGHKLFVENLRVEVAVGGAVLDTGKRCVMM